MGACKYVLCKVLALFYIGNPPLGGTGLCLDEVLVGQLEEVALGVVARILVKDLYACSLGADLGEEVLTVGIAVVVFCSSEGGLYGVGVVLEKLCPVSIGGIGTLATVFPEEEVVLEHHVVRNAHCKDTTVVTVVDDGHGLHGIVLEVDGSDLDFIGSVNAEQGTDTITHGVVHEPDRFNLGGFADVECVTAAAGDTVHVAGVKGEFANLDEVGGVSVEEARLEIGDFAVDELDGLNIQDTAGVVHDTCAGIAVELDVLKVEGCIVGKTRSKLNHTNYGRFFTVRTKLAHDAEA